jgi:hypothetical protein
MSERDQRQRMCEGFIPDNTTGKAMLQRLTLADGAFVPSAADGIYAGIGKDMLANVNI